MPGPLAGLRVLEMANVITGPYAGSLLADLDAEVIKVEMPGTGDLFRYWSGGRSQISPPFAAFNRNKKSVTIDVRKPEGAACYLKLAASVDVVIENFRPGTLDRLGVGYAAVRDLNPGIVYCSISGVGSTGPDSHRPTYDAIVQARSGLWSQFTDVDHPEPVGPAMSDQLTGVYTAYGILGALMYREHTGEGQYLETSMLAVTMAFQTSPVALALLEGLQNDKWSRATRSQTYAFIASDGLPLAVHLSTPDKFWRGLCTTVGRTDLIDDERYAQKSGRIAHYHDLLAELTPEFAAKPREYWITALQDADVPVAPINTVAEALADEQVAEIGILQEYGDGDDRLLLAGSPISYARSQPQSRGGTPRVGEHTDAILSAVGVPADELARLKQSSVI